MAAAKVLLAAVVATALLGAGCTRAASPGTPGDQSGSTPAQSVPSGSVLPEPSSSDSSSEPRTPSTTPATSSAPPSKPPSSSPVALGCLGSSLGVTLQRGAGVTGHQYATVTFKNISATKCPLAGFPGVQLLKAGAPIGTSVRSGATATTVELAPGASATAQLINDSTCGSDLSDSVQVIPPNTATKIVLPLVFRGCTVSVDPVVPA